MAKIVCNFNLFDMAQPVALVDDEGIKLMQYTSLEKLGANMVDCAIANKADTISINGLEDYAKKIVVDVKERLALLNIKSIKIEVNKEI